MEQKLIEEGLPESEVKRLCDVHVQVFKESLEGQPLPSAIPGHPLRTLTEENRALEKILARFRGLLEEIKLGDGGASLAKLKDEVQSVWQTSPRWKSIISRRRTSSSRPWSRKG